MKSANSSEGVVWTEELLTGDTLLFIFKDIRRERTGVHAFVGIAIKDAQGHSRVLADDTYNITRLEDSRRLVRAAVEDIKGHDLLAGILTSERLLHDLREAARKTPEIWEVGQFEIVSYSENDEPEPLVHIVRPWVIQYGGSVMYAPGGSGKSYLLQAMAISITRGISTLFEVESAFPVLYINLERSPASLHRREKALMQAMGVDGRSGVEYLHASGMPLRALMKAIQRWTETTGGGIMLDSISRTGQGSLNDESVANSIVDMLNRFRECFWVAIAHTPRDGDHIFGSSHFEYGADLTIQVKAEKRDNVTGVSFEVDKSNETAKKAPIYYSLEFDHEDGPITGIRVASQEDFPDLAIAKGLHPEERMVNAINESKDGALLVKDIASRGGIDYAEALHRVQTSPRFHLLRKTDDGAIYGLNL